MTSPSLLLIKDAAARLGVSCETIRRMRIEGRLSTVVVRKRAMVPVSEIERLISVNRPPVVGPVGIPEKLPFKKVRLFPRLK